MCAGVERFDRSKDEKDDAGDGDTDEERGANVVDKDVWCEGDCASEEVGKADGEGGDVHAGRCDWFKAFAKADEERCQPALVIHFDLSRLLAAGGGRRKCTGRCVFVFDLAKLGSDLFCQFRIDAVRLEDFAHFAFHFADTGAGDAIARRADLEPVMVQLGFGG